MPNTTTVKGMNVFADEGVSYAPPRYHRAAGKEALLAITPELDRLDRDQLATIRVDVQLATYTALDVVALVSAPAVRQRFADLPAHAFDMAYLDGLRPTCFAMLYAHAEARAAGALEDSARLSASMAAEAAELEARMQAVCEYQLGDDPEIKPELDRLRPGIGYRDLANDLMGYARIYELRPDAVKADQKHYRAGDAARAEELAGAILQTYSAMAARTRAAQDVYVGVWTLLTRRYEEVRAAGLWLFRQDPRVEARFPSLFTAGRSNVGRPRKVTPKDVDVETDGATGGAPLGELGGEATPA